MPADTDEDNREDHLVHHDLHPNSELRPLQLSFILLLYLTIQLPVWLNTLLSFSSESNCAFFFYYGDVLSLFSGRNMLH